MIGTTRGWTALWVLAIALSAHALLPYFPFPQPEDYSFAPLAEAWANPALYPRDDQVQSFAPTPWPYIAVYWLAKVTVNAGSGFWLATVLLTVASVFGLHAVMQRCGARGIALPLAVAIGLMAARPGLGSGSLGGLASGFFHHQWIALVLAFWAFAAIFARKPALAGLALGAAAYAQPATALQGAVAIAGACALLGRPGLRCLAFTALAAASISAPVIYAGLIAAPALEVPDERLITEGYRFAAPGHFRLDGKEVLLGWGFLALGMISAALLRRARPAEAKIAIGLLGGLGVFHLLATLFYWAMPAGPLWAYMLDATRSSPLYFALSAVLFAAAAEGRASQGEGWRGLLPLVPAAVIAVAIMVVNGLPTGWFFLLAGLLVIAAPGRAVPRLALAVTLLLAFAMIAPSRYQLRSAVDPRRLDLAEWAIQTTDADALFIVPPGMRDFRLFAQRSVYADFALFAAAGPRQGWFARQRLERIAEPGREARTSGGASAMGIWDRSYLIAATCSSIVALIQETGADYFVRPVQSSDDQRDAGDPCGGNPMVAFRNSTLTVYTLDPAKAQGSQ